MARARHIAANHQLTNETEARNLARHYIEDVTPPNQDAARLSLLEAHNCRVRHDAELKMYYNLISLIRAIEDADVQRGVATTLRMSVDNLRDILADMPDVAQLMDELRIHADHVEEDRHALTAPLLPFAEEEEEEPERAISPILAAETEKGNTKRARVAVAE